MYEILSNYSLLNLLSPILFRQVCLSANLESNNNMATLTCLIIDNSRHILIHPFEISIPLDSLVGDMDKIIWKQVQITGTFTFWKILAPSPIMKSKVEGIKFPILFLNGVQCLHPNQSISSYWNETPNPDHLHVIVERRSTSPLL